MDTIWTEADENKWIEMEARRKKHKREVKRMQVIYFLREIISTLERGDEEPIWTNVPVGHVETYSIEDIEKDQPYSFVGEPPITGKKITLIYWNDYWSYFSWRQKQREAD